MTRRTLFFVFIFRKLVIVFFAFFNAILFWLPVDASAIPASSDIPVSQESIIRSNNLAFNKLVFNLNSGSLVHSVSGDQIYVSERASSLVTKYKLVEKRLIFQSSIQIAHSPDGILILDLHSADSNNLYISYVDEDVRGEMCGRTKIALIKNFNSSKVIYESTPCLSGVGSWSEVAGRMTSDGKSLFITGGNILTELYRNRFPRAGLCCNLPKSYQATMRTSNLYGKVLRINLKTLKAEAFASGFRGPQGLAWDQFRSRLWETEHGPQGGDELNHISKGKNYGWPFVSLGLPYFPEDAELSGLPKKPIYLDHTGYQAPVFYWSPSIAPSQLVVIGKDSPFFKSFPNDLVVSTLKDQSLIRISMTKSGVVQSTERIEIGQRIRDFSSSLVGLVLSTDYGDIIVLTPNIDTDLYGPYPPVGKRPGD
jgi:glucose/arabinose dehydrogenase